MDEFVESIIHSPKLPWAIIAILAMALLLK